MRLDVDKEVIILSRDHAKTDESVGEFRRFRSEGGNAAKCLSGNEAGTAYAEYNGKRGEEELRGPTRDRRTPPNASPKSAGGAREKTFSGAIPSRQISPRESLQDRFHRRCRGPFPHRRCGFTRPKPRPSDLLTAEPMTLPSFSVCGSGASVQRAFSEERTGPSRSHYTPQPEGGGAPKAMSRRRRRGKRRHPVGIAEFCF